MKSKINRILSLLLALTFIIPLTVSPALASNVTEPEPNTNTDVIDRANEIFEKKDTLVSENQAYSVAESLIFDCTSFDEFVWDENTKISNTVPLYDETGTDTVVAYSFELSNGENNQGYIVVSANLDAPSLILEFSDVAEPLYNELDLNENEKVIYLGSIDYLKDLGDSTLEDIDGDIIECGEVVNTLQEKRDDSNIFQNAITAIISEDYETYFSDSESVQSESFLQEETFFDNASGATTLNGDLSTVITDPQAHANTNSQGPFEPCGDWINNWESYVHGSRTDDYPNFMNHCGPVAITNIIKSYGNRYNNNIVKMRDQDIFREVWSLGHQNGYCTNEAGTFNDKAGQYIRDSMKKYGIKATVSGQFTTNYNNIKSCLGDNRLLYLMLSNHYTYDNHAVLCYAYARLKSSTTGWYRTYLKVADGYAYEKRYIDLSSATNGKFWSVKF